MCLCENYGASQLPRHYGEPVHYLLVDMMIVSLLIYRFHAHSSELWVTFVKGLWPVFSGQTNMVTISCGNLENQGTSEYNNIC